jgi:hypothetical protein
MMVKRFSAVCAAICIGLFSFNCDLFGSGDEDKDDVNVNPTQPSPPSGTDYVQAMEYSYTEPVTGQLTVIETETGCNGSQLVTLKDTLVSTYTIAGDVMTIITVDGLEKDTMQMTRVNGTGLQGLWDVITETGDTSAGMMAGGQIYITASAIQMWPAKSAISAQMQQMMMGMSSQMPSSEDGLSMGIVPSMTGATLTGLISGEVVTVAVDTVNLTINWTSTNAAHTAYVVDFMAMVVPVSCPYPETTPVWINEFFMANMTVPVDTTSYKSLAKALKPF